MSFIVRKATEEDALPIQHFISKIGVDPTLSTDWSSFLVAENEQGDFVSIVRIQQITEEIGLLRTLIVDSEKITSIFILEFLEATLHYAKNEGINALYMLAASDAGFLKNLGFNKVEKDSLPIELKSVDDVQVHLKKGLPIFAKINN
ncbi:N-acetylglutamate synthase-like GNAT family acetyltransferase [Evansella vedderi]|uniref:N-acetylglutamate synthase-like GNAT family acetyltransferase n=1 Tax=Evansella vedderi TaxID=38282 RepID=A0ABU0A124_9BACI|nr:hypothetical protein [Evansella vedderi]MDQ0257179.1 N-acetylglutamate synthase-like GNAT family acetyltransferase [Evansella vedderi]